MLEFQWIWRQFPRQLTSDLSRFHGISIGDWHRGEVSSYELICHVEFLPEESAFKTALRAGEYGEDQITWRHIANEIARLRATMHAVHGGQRYKPPTLLTRAEQREEIDAADATQERREDFFSFADRTPVPGLPESQAPLDPDDLDWNEAPEAVAPWPATMGL